MNITKTNEGGKFTIALDGRLDTTTAHQLQEAMLPAFDVEKDIFLDIARLEYVSSAGLRVLLMGEKTAKAKGGSMSLCNVSDEIMEVLAITGFNEILTIV